jgi:AraC-like DNA-binding protein
MAKIAIDFAPFHFSTDNVQERDRLAVFREVYGRVIAKMDFEPVNSSSVRVDAFMCSLPGLDIWVAAHSPMRGKRTGTYIANGNDNVALCISSEGGSIISQLGRELTHRAGDAVLLSGSDPLLSTMPALPRYVSLAVPRKTLASMVPGLEDVIMRPVPRDTEALRLLVGYVQVLVQDHALATPELHRLVVGHIQDLIAFALGASRDATEVVKGRGVRAARLHAIKTDIREALGHPDLTLSAISTRHSVTPRYVQMLFESENSTFSQFVLEQRLARTHLMLTDARFSHHKIGTIAFEAGFTDLSHFNRAFRRRYGGTPSEVRAAARHKLRE